MTIRIRKFYCKWCGKERPDSPGICPYCHRFPIRTIDQVDKRKWRKIEGFDPGQDRYYHLGWHGSPYSPVWWRTIRGGETSSTYTSTVASAIRRHLTLILIVDVADIWVKKSDYKYYKDFFK